MKLKNHRLGAVAFALTSALSVIASSQPASAAITITTGSGKVYDAPDSVKKNKWESNGKTRIFLEQLNVKLSEDLSIKINNVPEQTAAQDLFGITLFAGAQIDSYMLHQDSKGTKSIRLKGTITFDEDIVGVIFGKSALFASDPVTGALGTQYPSSSQGMRRIELTGDSKDRFWISADMRTLKYDLRTSKDDVDQIRIFTTSFNAVPAPGCLALLSTAFATATFRRRRSS